MTTVVIVGSQHNPEARFDRTTLRILFGIMIEYNQDVTANDSEPDSNVVRLDTAMAGLGTQLGSFIPWKRAGDDAVPTPFPKRGRHFAHPSAPWLLNSQTETSQHGSEQASLSTQGTETQLPRQQDGDDYMDLTGPVPKTPDQQTDIAGSLIDGMQVDALDTYAADLNPHDGPDICYGAVRQ